MRRFTTEDRSINGSATPNSATRKENQSLQDLEHLTDFTAEEFDQIADMERDSELILGEWIYIKRTD